ncbi:hypothetical protein ABPG75_000388 [Micractinium tetrahymenae]
MSEWETAYRELVAEHAELQIKYALRGVERAKLAAKLEHAQAQLNTALRSHAAQHAEIPAGGGGQAAGD